VYKIDPEMTFCVAWDVKPNSHSLTVEARPARGSHAGQRQGLHVGKSRTAAMHDSRNNWARKFIDPQM